MRRIFLIFLFDLSFGAFAYASIVPHYAFAAPRIIHRQVSVTALKKREYAQSNYEIHIKMMDRPPGKIYAQPESLTEKRFQNSLRLPWPPINLPDFSFLWEQERSGQKKDMYDRGQ